MDSGSYTIRIQNYSYNYSAIILFCCQVILVVVRIHSTEGAIVPKSTVIQERVVY